MPRFRRRMRGQDPFPPYMFALIFVYLDLLCCIILMSWTVAL